MFPLLLLSLTMAGKAFVFNATNVPQQSENSLEALLAGGWLDYVRRLPVSLATAEIRMSADSCQLLPDLFGWQDKIDTAGGDGAVGHTVILCRSLLLSEGDAALCLDRGQAASSVGSCS